MKKHYLFFCILILSFLASYSSAEKVNKDEFNVGNEITFGHYLQNINTQEASSIEWIILKKEKNLITVISKKVLEEMSFHNDMKGAYWPKSSLRNWLNNDFYKTAFSKDEQKAIVATTHSYYIYNNELNKQKQSSKDKVFLLNVSEASECFVEQGKSRTIFGFGLSSYESHNDNIVSTKKYYHAEITPYAYRDHLYNNMAPVGSLGNKDWWLCDSYADKEFASYTGGSNSELYVYYERVIDKHGVRPVVVLDLNKCDAVFLQKSREDNSVIVSNTSVENKTEYTIMLGFNIDFKRNHFFSKYDVELYVDDECISTLKHGVKDTATCRISNGSHNVFFYKKEDHSIVTKTEITINDHSYLDCSISTNRNGIELKDVKIISRYNISDSQMLSYLKEYDAIIDQLSFQYDIASHKRENSRTNYKDLYFLLSSKSKEALCFIVPKHIYNDNPVTFGTGSFTGNLASGKVSVTLQGGRTFEVSISQSKSKSEKLKGFYSVCDELILRMYPRIHGGYVSVKDYLLENDRKQYDLICMD